MAGNTTDPELETAMKSAIRATFATEEDDRSGAELHNVDTESAPSAERARLESEPVETAFLSSSVAFDLLAEQRRRYALYYLKGCEYPATLNEVTEQVAVWETETNAAEIPNAVYERIHLELTNTHLPKLVDVGVVTYDAESQLLALAEGIGQFEACLERVAESEYRQKR